MGVVGITGELPSLRQQIVAAGQLRPDPQQAAGHDNDLLLPGKVVVALRNTECKIQVAQVVKHRPAAGEPPCQSAPLAFQKARAAFPPGILVAADDHGVLVLPEIENAASLVGHGLRQILLQRQIAVWICVRAEISVELPDHACFHRSTGLRAACTSSGRPMGILWGAVCMASASSNAFLYSIRSTSAA